MEISCNNERNSDGARGQSLLRRAARTCARRAGSGPGVVSAREHNYSVRGVSVSLVQSRETRRCCRRTATCNISRRKKKHLETKSRCGVARSRHAACAPQESWALLTGGRQGTSRWMQGPICLKPTHRAGSAVPSRPSAWLRGDVVSCRTKAQCAARGAHASPLLFSFCHLSHEICYINERMGEI